MGASLGDLIDIYKCCIVTWGAVTTVLPAFLMAGAITVFVSSGSVIRYFGARAKKWLSYGMASVSGQVLSVCSCNVVPIFTGILRRGAGLGPAFTFVYAAPAIHFVTMVYVFKVIGWRLGLWRTVMVPLIAIGVGLAMALIFREKGRAREAAELSLPLEQGWPGRRVTYFLGLLLLVLLYGALPQSMLSDSYRLLDVGLLLGAAGLLAVRSFGREETGEWLRQSWILIRQMIPLFLVAVVLIWLVIKYVPIRTLLSLWGETPDEAGRMSALAIYLKCLKSTIFGALMYFPILTEVVFVKTMLKEEYMMLGPALAVLLTGPGLSLPGLLLVIRTAGVTKMLAYLGVMVALVSGVSFLFGIYYGGYQCPCKFGPASTSQVMVTPWLGPVASLAAGAIFLWALVATRARRAEATVLPD